MVNIFLILYYKDKELISSKLIHSSWSALNEHKVCDQLVIITAGQEVDLTRIVMIEDKDNNGVGTHKLEMNEEQAAETLAFALEQMKKMIKHYRSIKAMQKV